MMRVLEIGLGQRSYQIVIAKEAFETIGNDVAEKFPASRYCIVTDDKVGGLYGKRLLQTLQEKGLEVDMLVFPEGEESKNLETVGKLASSAARARLDRKSLFIALGGGVAGDIAGFLASAYMRGIPFIQVPTTLLAQVDSSVGGKTGVDLPEGKNLFGAFYQPLEVIIDPDVLRTLPEKQYLNGMAEVIKYGVIREPQFLDFLKRNHRQIMDQNPDIVSEMIHTCCRMKAEIVGEDERENDTRRILNYGHTLGHAVEATSSFTIAHGFAVAIGMVAAARIAVSKSMLSREKADSIISLIKLYNLPTEIPADLDREVIKSYLLTDKKRVGDKTSYILPEENGTVVITEDVSENEINAVLDYRI